MFICLCCLFISSQSAGADQLNTSETVYIDGKPCGTFCRQFFPDDVIRRARRLPRTEERTESRSTYHATTRRVVSHETVAHNRMQKRTACSRVAERRSGPSKGDGHSSDTAIKQLHSYAPTNVKTDDGVKRSAEPPTSAELKTTEETHEAQSAVIPRPKPDIQLAEAFALADRLSVKPVDFDRSQHSQATETKAPTTERSEPLTALLLTANDTGEISALSGKVVALNDSLAGSAALIRTAIVAAGAPNVQLSDSQEAPLEALRRGEISAAVLGVVTAEQAQTFPEVSGFRLFRVPLAPI